MLFEILKRITLATKEINADLFEGPRQPVGSRKVIGVVPEDLRKIWILVVSREHETRQEILSAMHAPTELMASVIEHATGTGAFYRFAMDLFWNELRERFGLWEYNSIGVCEDWQIAVESLEDSLPRQTESGIILLGSAGAKISRALGHP